MRTLLLMLSFLFFSGCAPTYKTTYHYKTPDDPKAKTCIQDCKEKLTTCKALCKSNYELCTKRIEPIAKKRYEEKLKSYYQALEQYANEMERYNMEIDLFYGPRGYGFHRGVFNPLLGWHTVPPSYTIQKPIKPNLAQEIQRLELQECRIDCHCLESYDSCFKGCGGEIKIKKECLTNCPK